MKTISSNMSIAQLCQEFEEKKIIVNRDYQRSDKVWPDTARSFLIETILLDYPVPKLALYQTTDLKTKRTMREIVDGQQRTAAIYDFFKSNLKLSKTIERDEFKNRTFDELDDDTKGKFLSYSLSIDIFAAATPADIAEIFRRMNSYNVPLNPEEQRHANFQGDFKWYISNLSRELNSVFVRCGIFDEKRIVRMEDNKLLTDICYALLNGISTTKKPQLDKIYKDKDKEFPEADLLSGLIRQAFATLGTFEELQKGVLMKPYNIYALVLALIHTTNPQEILTKSYANSHLLPRARSQNAQQQLTELVDAIVREDFEGKYGLFVKACKERTNVGEQRATRFSFFCNALIGA